MCIEMDCRHGLKEAELPCSHSYYYASLIGTGKVRVLKTFEEKLHGLKEVMRIRRERNSTTSTRSG